MSTSLTQYASSSGYYSRNFPKWQRAMESAHDSGTRQLSGEVDPKYQDFVARGSPCLQAVLSEYSIDCCGDLPAEIVHRMISTLGSAEALGVYLNASKVKGAQEKDIFYVFGSGHEDRHDQLYELVDELASHFCTWVTNESTTRSSPRRIIWSVHDFIDKVDTPVWNVHDSVLRLASDRRRLASSESMAAFAKEVQAASASDLVQHSLVTSVLPHCNDLTFVRSIEESLQNALYSESYRLDLPSFGHEWDGLGFFKDEVRLKKTAWVGQVHHIVFVLTLVMGAADEMPELKNRGLFIRIATSVLTSKQGITAIMESAFEQEHWTFPRRDPADKLSCSDLAYTHFLAYIGLYLLTNRELRLSQLLSSMRKTFLPLINNIGDVFVKSELNVSPKEEQDAYGLSYELDELAIQ